jgi:hypothetical protein
MEVVPYFSTDEEILPLHLSALFLQEIHDGIANLFFVLIKPRTI